MNGFKEFFVETYDLDLLMEVSTLAQTLKQHQDPELIKLMKLKVRERLLLFPWFNEPMGKKMLDRYVNFFTYNVLQDRSWQDSMNQMLKNPTHQQGRWEIPSVEIKQMAAQNAAGTVNHMWRGLSDYFTSMGDRLASKVNNPGYTIQAAEQESREWHEDLATRARGLPNQEAVTIINLGETLGKKWEGWKWVDLEAPYCSEEANAMGHCGNEGYNKGDNIVSLRDPEGYAHLTFILNDGFLGESKGRGNQKPSAKYHDPIVELLKSDYVHVIKGGGYMPAHNFNMNDLHDDHKKKLEHKKHLDDPIGYILDKYKGKDTVGAINELFNTLEFESYDGENFTLNEFENWAEIEEAAKGWEGDIENMSWLDDPWEHFDGSHHGYTVSDLVEKLNRNNQDELMRHLKTEDPDELEELIGNDDAVEEALMQAASNAHEHAIEGEAYKNIQGQLSDPDENGFYIDFKTHPWNLTISKEKIRSLHKEMQADDTIDDGEFGNYIKLKYSPPYNGYDGYSDFDDDNFNEMLSDGIHNLAVA